MSTPSELERRIAQAERRLVAREQALNEPAWRLSRQIDHGVSKARAGAIVGAGLIGGALLALLLGGLVGRGGARDDGVEDHRAPAESTHASVPWVSAVIFALPLLSRRWAASPAARTATAVLLPMVARAWRGRGRTRVRRP